MIALNDLELTPAPNDLEITPVLNDLELTPALSDLLILSFRLPMAIVLDEALGFLWAISRCS